jgi:hypothetical protein
MTGVVGPSVEGRMRPRRFSILVVCVLAACSSGEGERDPFEPPPLAAGFVEVERFENRSNATLTSFNLGPVGVAVDGDRVAVLTLRGVVQGASSSEGHSAQSLHVSDDGGRTFVEHVVAPAGDGEPLGRLTGLAFAGGRLVSRLRSESAIAIVELDPERGTYEKLRLEYDGNEVFPHGHLYVDGDELEWASTDAYRSSFYADRVDLRTLEVRYSSYFGLECSPALTLDFLAGTWLFPSYVMTGGVAQGICHSAASGFCHTRFWLGDDPEIGAPGNYPCASDESLFPGVDPASVATDFGPRVTLATPGGIRVAGVQNMDDGTAHAVIVGLLSSPQRSGPLRIDLGPGFIDLDDTFGFGHRLADTIAFSPHCELSDSFGRCLDPETEAPLEPAAEPALLAPTDELATEYAPLALARPCEDRAWCPTVPTMMTRDASSGRYFTVWALEWRSTVGITEYGSTVLVAGFVDDPREPETPPEPASEDATPLELRCWAEVACDPWAVPEGASPGYTERLQQQTCVERWVRVRGAPDDAYATFLAADPLDCDALLAADPSRHRCEGEGPSCSADGSTLECAYTTFGYFTSCAQANGGTCTVDGTTGQPGCYADACPSATSGPHCDDLGRAVDCGAGLVDDCSARGLVCVSGVIDSIDAEDLLYAGCSPPDLACDPSAGSSQCQGSLGVDCSFGVPREVVDCSRIGGECAYGGCGATFEPEGTFGCAGDVLRYYGLQAARRVDCAAVGLSCHDDPLEPGHGWCGA